jgi:hypothetical protein
MPISPKIREAIYARDGHRCVACLTSNNLTLQHRVSKGMGGSKLFDTPALLITMCLSCNVELESSSSKAERGRENGWKISRNAYPPIDPTTIPVKIGKRWFYLDNEFHLIEKRDNA